MNDSGLSYSCSFEEERDKLVQYVLSWGEGTRTENLDFSQFESSIVLKNWERIVVADSPLLRKHFSEHKTLIGKDSDSILDGRLRKVSKITDELILEGISSIEFEYITVLPNGNAYLSRIYKRRLDELADPNYTILILSRPISVVAMPTEYERHRSLTELLAKFQQLEEMDRAICFGHANGDQIKDIATRLGISTRSIENRRQKIMDLFGFTKPIEIVKMLVRLEERGLL